jgi:hypothetical protein
VSLADTLSSFIGLCIPAILLFGMEIAVHKLSKPRSGEPIPSPIAWGAVPAAGYLVVAAVSLAAAGPW